MRHHVSPVPAEPAMPQIFPMMTVPLETLLAMTRIQTHEDLLQVGALVEFSDTLGKAMFVSHQWVHSQHPDPDCEQFAVLQEALRNLVTGKSKVSLYPGAEAIFGRVQCPKSSDHKADRTGPETPGHWPLPAFLPM